MDNDICKEPLLLGKFNIYKFELSFKNQENLYFLQKIALDNNIRNSPDLKSLNIEKILSDLKDLKEEKEIIDETIKHINEIIINEEITNKSINKFDEDVINTIDYQNKDILMKTLNDKVSYLYNIDKEIKKNLEDYNKYNETLKKKINEKNIIDIYNFYTNLNKTKSFKQTDIPESIATNYHLNLLNVNYDTKLYYSRKDDRSPENIHILGKNYILVNLINDIAKLAIKSPDNYLGKHLLDMALNGETDYVSQLNSMIVNENYIFIIIKKNITSNEYNFLIIPTLNQYDTILAEKCWNTCQGTSRQHYKKNCDIIKHKIEGVVGSRAERTLLSRLLGSRSAEGIKSLTQKIKKKNKKRTYKEKNKKHSYKQKPNQRKRTRNKRHSTS